jgi:hypothetical protein
MPANTGFHGGFMFQKWTFAIATAVLLVFSCTMMMASTNTMGIAEKQTINFTAPTLIGSTILPAGNYNVTHEMNGQTHIMIFKQIGGRAESTATCTLVPLTAKATRSEQHFKQNAKNERVLIEMTFAGDKATHVLAQ